VRVARENSLTTDERWGVGYLPSSSENASDKANLGVVVVPIVCSPDCCLLSTSCTGVETFSRSPSCATT
jgi:hypothetical protein